MTGSGTGAGIPSHLKEGSTLSELGLQVPPTRSQALPQAILLAQVLRVGGSEGIAVPRGCQLVLPELQPPPWDSTQSFPHWSSTSSPSPDFRHCGHQGQSGASCPACCLLGLPCSPVVPEPLTWTRGGTGELWEPWLEASLSTGAVSGGPGRPPGPQVVQRHACPEPVSARPSAEQGPLAHQPRLEGPQGRKEREAASNHSCPLQTCWWTDSPVTARPRRPARWATLCAWRCG